MAAALPSKRRIGCNVGFTTILFSVNKQPTGVIQIEAMGHPDCLPTQDSSEGRELRIFQERTPIGFWAGKSPCWTPINFECPEEAEANMARLYRCAEAHHLAMLEHGGR